MARKSATKVTLVESEVEEIDFTKEFLGAFEQYGKFVNYGRALPSAIDGLRVVHRHIIWSMWEATRCTPEKAHVKAARVVGDVMGIYHPHGDCLDGDTGVLGLDGSMHTLEMLAKEGSEAIWVLSVDANGAQVPALAHSFRVGQHATAVHHVRLSDSTTLTVTDNHPFRTAEGQWIKARDLKAGQMLTAATIPDADLDALRDSNGSANGQTFRPALVTVLAVDVQDLLVPRPMYDFTVDGHENMYVVSGRAGGGTAMVVVHNSSIYGSMVGMEQDFKRRVPLIDGKGNWGGIHNDLAPAAAPRYTECRMTPAAVAMLGGDRSIVDGAAEVSENAVEMVPNYDGIRDEPVVLPALWPAFVVNGDMGVGVGIAGSTASHNLREVMNLAIKLMDGTTPRMATVRDLLPGPDMPCDADIYDTDDGGIEQYMTTGVGRFIMRARFTTDEYEITPAKGRTPAVLGHRIIITGLPYDIAPEHVSEGIADMVENKMLVRGIAMTDASSMTNGTRLIIDVGDLDVDDVVQRLLHSPKSKLQQSFSVSMNAILDGQITVVSVLDGLRAWIAHRRIVIRRRSRYRLEHDRDRLEVVDGYLMAVPVSNEILEIVKASANKDVAAEVMVSRLGFTRRQADAVLEMTIGQITRLGVDRYQGEKQTLEARIAEWELLLSDPEALDARMKKEMRAVRDTYGTPRRCRLIEGSAKIAKPTTPAVVEPKVPGYLIRTGRNWIRWAQRPNTKLTVGNDHVVATTKSFDTSAIDVVSDRGTHYRLLLGSLPDKMTNVAALLPLAPGEKVVLADTAPEGHDLVVVTSTGGVKRLAAGDLVLARKVDKGRPVVTLSAGESVEHAFFLPPKHDIALVTARAKVLRMAHDAISAKGRAARTVPGIKLATPDDRVVLATAAAETDRVTYYTENARIGSFALNEIRRAARGGQGTVFVKTVPDISGAVSGATDSIAYFDGSEEAPTTVEIPAPARMVGATEKQLGKADRILSAGAIWIQQG